MKSMRNVPASYCQCYSDCNNTMYQYFVTSAPLRPCDSRNFGLSRLCNFNDKSLRGPSFYKNVIDKILKGVPFGIVPVEDSFELFFLMEGSKRYVNDQLLGSFEYDAFERDIALVEVYYPSPTIMKLKTQAKMGWIDYFSTVGGLLGLVLGMGFISFVELVWLALRIAALKLNFQNIIP